MFSHKTQPTADSCMSTCIAMLVDIDENVAYDQWHEKFHSRKAWLDTALDSYDIHYLYGSPRSGTLIRGFAYLLTVPSLNIEAGLHQVLTVLPPAGDIKVLDPVKGRGRRYYVYEDPQGPEEVCLKSWVIDLAIPLTRETLGE